MLKKLGFVLLFILAGVNANAAEKNDVAKLYVATFNRAADAIGLAYWDGSSQVHTTLVKLEDIASAIVDGDEYIALYGGMDRERAIIEMYSNLFNRVVDGTDEGLQYWTIGNGSSIPMNLMILALINGAEAPTGNPIDAAVLANKTSIGVAFANAGLNDKSQARDIMMGITEDNLTVSAALASFGINLSNEVPDASPINDYFGDSVAFSNIQNGSVIVHCVLVSTNEVMRLSFNGSIFDYLLTFNEGFGSFSPVPVSDSEVALYNYSASATSIPVVVKIANMNDTIRYDNFNITSASNSFQTATNIMIGTNSCHVYHILSSGALDNALDEVLDGLGQLGY